MILFVDKTFNIDWYLTICICSQFLKVVSLKNKQILYFKEYIKMVEFQSSK